VRRRSQARPTKDSGRPINIVTTLAGSGTAVTVAWTENPSETGVVEFGGTRLMVMTFVNEYGTAAREEIGTGGGFTPREGGGGVIVYNEVETLLGRPKLYVLWAIAVLGEPAE